MHQRPTVPIRTPRDPAYPHRYVKIMLPHATIDISQEAPSSVIPYRHVLTYMVVIQTYGHPQKPMAFAQDGTL
jgi:hypothetical protein